MSLGPGGVALLTIEAIVAVSEPGSCPIVITWPTRKPLALPTKSVVSPAAAATRTGVGPPVTKTAPLFSRTAFAVATPPQSQPARVNGTHGAGAVAPLGEIMFWTVGVPAADIGSVQ